MMFGRSRKCVTTSSQKVIPHDELMDRIRKTFYFGGETRDKDMRVSRPLADYAAELFSEPHRGHSLNRLHVGELPPFTVHATPCSLIMALIYLDRLNVMDPGYVRRITPQELFIVSMMVSTKFYIGHDEEFYLRDWTYGDVTEEKLKQLELEFLCAIEWNIYISNEDFFKKLTGVEKTLARREGLRRGWLTYTELIQMLPSFTLAKFLMNNITIMAVSYAASVMTIAASFFLVSQIPGTVLHRKATDLKENAAGNLSEPLLTNDADVMLPPPSNRAANGTVTIAATHNSSLNGLNVEAELSKLERQFREEAERERLLRHQNEISAGSRLSLPKAAAIKQLNVVAPHKQHSHVIQRNWLALKAVYSDIFDINPRATCHPADGKPLNVQTSKPTSNNKLPRNQLNDCFDNVYNYTGMGIWQLLADTTQQSVHRWPSIWLKFM